MKKSGRTYRTVSISIASLSLLSLVTVQAASDVRLADAVERQQKATVRALLKQGGDVNGTQPDGATALHWAVHWDDVETTELLLKAGAKANAANDLGITALFMSASSGNAILVDKLLAAGADANTASMSGETALMSAARTGSADAVRALLERGANVNAHEATRGQTALMWAAAARHPAVVKLLLDHRADVNARSQTRRIVANMGGNRSSGSASFDIPLGEVEQGGSTPLLFAAREGDVESARLLIAAGASVNDAAADGTSALVIATHSANHAVAQLLLDEGADPDAPDAGHTALHSAVLRSDLRDPLVELGFLREKESEWRALDHTAGLNMVKVLLAHGANPNAQVMKAMPVRRWSQDFVFLDRWRGATPFWLASKFLEIDMMRALAGAGANPQLPSKDGTTPLMVAAGLGYSKATGTAAFVRDRRDFSYYNAQAEDSAAVVPEDEERVTLDAVKLVVQLGADVTVANAAGDTALHGAAGLGMTKVIQFLVESGAQLTAKNKNGVTPLKAAARYKVAADLLRKLGATE